MLPTLPAMRPPSALRRRYVLLVECGLLIALALLIAAVALPFDFDAEEPHAPLTTPAIEAIEVPPTTQPRELPPPPAPIEVPDDVVLDEPVDIPSISDEPLAPAAIPTLPSPPSPPAARSEPEAPEIFEIVEEEPVLIGGLEGLQRRVDYPELARRAGIEGTAIVQFVVDERGAVTRAVVLRDPGGGLGDAALRAVRASAFEPGRQRGSAVKVRLSLPVRFRLR